LVELSFQARPICVVELVVADSPLGASGCPELAGTLAKHMITVNQMKCRQLSRPATRQKEVIVFNRITGLSKKKASSILQCLRLD